MDVEDSDKLIEEYKKKLETLNVPEEVTHVLNEEMVVTHLLHILLFYSLTKMYPVAE